MATIRERKSKKGPSYMAEIRIKGYPPQTASFKRLTDAKRWVQQTESAIREGRYFKTSESRKHTVSELIEKYEENILPLRGRDRKTVEGELRWWKTELGHYGLADITPQMISELRDKLATEPIERKESKDSQEEKVEKKAPKYRTAATIIRYLASLSVCFSYAVKDLGWIEENPTLKVRKPSLSNGRVRFLSEKERDDLLKACKKRTRSYIYTVVVIALSTGARMSEIMHLQWKDIDLKKRIMRLEQTKNGEKRAIPLSTHALKVIQQLNKVRRIDTDYLFPRADGKKPFEIKRHWQKAVEDAGLKDFKFHDLRHTAASYLAMNGATLLEISNILGHKQMKMVKRYAHLTEQHTASVLEKMNKQQFKGA